MKVKELTLQNIRSYKDQTVTFPEGTILIHGENGAGKTSLLMGIFGGLFLSDITHAGEQSFTLDDLIRRGEEKAHIKLVFELDGTDYTVEWTFYATSTGPSATLTSPAFSEPVSQVSNVKEKIQDLLGMDKDDFSASVYVRQGEINRLIDADTRTELIDSLLNLDAIDAYISKMEGARRGAKRVRRDNKTARENAGAKREQKYDRNESQFASEIQGLTEEIQEVQAEKDKLDERIEEFEQRQTALEGQIDSYETTREKIATKEEQISEAQQARATTEQERQEAQDEITAAQTAIADVEENVADLNEAVEHDLSTEDATERAAKAVQDEYTTAHQQRTKHEAALGNERETLKEIKNERAETEERVASLEAALEDEKASLEAKRTELTEEQELLDRHTERRNEKASAFLPETTAAGITDDSRATVEDRIEQLDAEREQAAKEQTRIQTKLEGKASELEQTRSDISEKEQELERARAELEDHQSELEALTDAVTTAKAEFEGCTRALEQTGEELDIDISPDSLETARDELIPTRRSALTTEIGSVSEEIARLEAREEQLRTEIEELQTLGTHNECPKCGQAVDDSHVEDEIEQQQNELAAIDETLAEQRTVKAELESERTAVDDLLDDVRDAIAYREDVLTPRRTERQEGQTQVETAETEVDTLEEELEDRKEAVSDLENDIESLERERSDLTEQVERQKAAIEDGETAIAAFEAVERHRETVRSLRETVEETETAIEEYETELQEAHTAIKEQDSRIETQKQTVTECEKALRTAEERVERIEEEKTVVDRALEQYETISEHRNEIQRLKQTVTHCEEKIQRLNQHLRTLKREKSEFEDELGDTDIEELREDHTKIADHITELEAAVKQREEKIQSLREARTSREKELENLRELKADIDRYERRHQWADAIVGEIDTMLAVYRRSKSQLREQYLDYLREYTNDIFDEVYKNSSYQQVIIREIETNDDFEYDLKLLRNDQQLEDPSNASGGERAIVNLALRAGIYRLIAELKGDDRGTLPPFILDEPTTFLDEGHVSQLEEMLETIKSWDVPQVIVVSHDERLIHGADNECRVTIDEETNTSQIEMRAAGDDTTAVGDD